MNDGEGVFFLDFFPPPKTEWEEMTQNEEIMVLFTNNPFCAPATLPCGRRVSVRTSLRCLHSYLNSLISVVFCSQITILRSRKFFKNQQTYIHTGIKNKTKPKTYYLLIPLFVNLDMSKFTVVFAFSLGTLSAESG